MHSKILLSLIVILIITSCKNKVDQDLKVTNNKTSNSHVQVLSKPDAITLDMITELQNSLFYLDPLKVPYLLSKKKIKILQKQLKNEPGKSDLNLQLTYAIELLNSGDTQKSIDLLVKIIPQLENANFYIEKETLLNVKKKLAIAYMRKAEQENCLVNHNSESCIIPFSDKAKHKLKDGGLECIKVLNSILKTSPNDLECQYLLNVAHMAVGQYPSGVPKEFRINESFFESSSQFPKFHDIAMDLGVAVNNLSGGTCVDDFNNDGYLDIIASSWGIDDQINYFENDKKGGFSNKTKTTGLIGVTGGLNIKHADFNNDGFLDFIILRGAWMGNDGKIPNSLIQNNGDGTFSDVTKQVGLFSLKPTQTAVWADFNLDGWVDLLIGNESNPSAQFNVELFLNEKGKFREVSKQTGLDKIGFFKGIACGDINNDGYLDIYMSNYISNNILYLNTTKEGILSFSNITSKAKVNKPEKSFSTWMFDYNNDGYDDIFVSGYSTDEYSGASLMVKAANQNHKGNRPLLYHNNGDCTFDERSLEMGLNEAATTMGCNFGDLNNDGYLDFYLATGSPSFYSIVPNKVYLNDNGKHFSDVTYNSGFGHIQKGHAIGFGDLDMDGDQDIYAVMGGAYSGDVYGNLLYENPIGNKNNWIHVSLEGTKSNRSAIGAKLILTIVENNQQRKIYHNVGIDASFGGNSFLAEIGIGKAIKVNQLEVIWPNPQRTKNTFTDLNINQIIKITEGENKIRVLNIEPVVFNQKANGHHHHQE